jgi:hypothetical protein
MHIIPATLEVDIGGWLFEASPGKMLVKPYLKEQGRRWWFLTVLSYIGGRSSRITIQG